MLIVGISGGTGSGKTTVVNKIIQGLPKQEIIVLSQDNYYHDNKVLSFEEREKINFDHPRAIDFDLLIEHLIKLKNGKSIQQPTYSFITHTRTGNVINITPHNVIIVEGILILANKILRNLFNIKIFIDTDADERLVRRIKRDISERGRNIEEILCKYKKIIKPMHEQFIEPSKYYADIIIPNTKKNNLAINILKSLIKNGLIS